MRLFVIGDIHGNFREFDTLVENVGFGRSDTLVTLGDHIDVGPDSRRVIDLLITLRDETNLISLTGNHEIMMLRAKDDPAALREWRRCGGTATLTSYNATTLDAIPVAHWDFISKGLRYFEQGQDFFVHANVAADVPLPEQPDLMLFWEALGNPAPHFSGKRMICGHTTQKSGRPLNLGHAICIDTWSPGGWLTCLEPATGRYWQANERRQTRKDTLS